MPLFMISGSYSSGSWARMIQTADDRTDTVRSLMESIGGSLEQLYWDVDCSAAYAIADLPDSSAASAVTTAIAQTGAFKAVQVHELLTQSALSRVLTMARDVSRVYRVPGRAAVERDISPA
jgi:uncharacterized protein with GYD domain